jgi:formylglycine-generating enzyme required for sulfatase activity
MVRIKGGAFHMGDVFDDNAYKDEKPVHRVTLSDFYLATHELTFAEYEAFCRATGQPQPDPNGWGRGRRPVIDVSWYDALLYCNWRSRREGLKEVYLIDGAKVTPDWNANGYRLPTEAEWEYAAREGGGPRRFGDGRNTADPARINFDASADGKQLYSIVGDFRAKTIPVGSLKAPNALGLHDMSGNVWEWCWDGYGAYSPDDQQNPRGPDDASDRVIRGGAWSRRPAGVRTTYRLYANPFERFNVVGIRLARSAL